jgi:hypothetical protein
MTIFRLECSDKDGNIETVLHFTQKEKAEKAKAKLDGNLRYQIIGNYQTIVKIETQD